MKPRHIAIIPDGNRRWARLHNMSKEEGYSIGIRNFGNALKWGRKLGIRMMTFWAFSTQNATRDRKEIRTLMKLFDKNLRDSLSSPDFQRHRIRVRILGNHGQFPRKIRDMLEKLESDTRQHDKYFVNLLVGYGGRDEILAACNRIISDAKGGRLSRVTEDTFSEYLCTRGLPDPDLIIRTSGEKRLSGFLPWQSAYSEFYFSRKLWPDFNQRDLKRAVAEFQRRQRRFGR